MTDKTEKSLKILSIVLPAAIILLLAVVIGLVLSSAFRIFDLIKKESEETHRTVILGELAIPVAEGIVVDSTPSARNFLEGLTDWNAVDEKTFFEGIHHNHGEGQNPISLKNLKTHDLDAFMRAMFEADSIRFDGQKLQLMDGTYPIEVLIPIDGKTAFAVFRLNDGTEDVYAYVEIGYFHSERPEEVSSGWIYNPLCYFVTERLTYEDVASLQVGDTVHDLIGLCPAIRYQLERPYNLYTSAYVVFLEEGILTAYIDDATFHELMETMKDPDRLSKWVRTARISDIIFVPFGDVLSEEEKAALIERNSKYESFMKYSSVPYVLLPE